jgi:hypothetical protein
MARSWLPRNTRLWITACQISRCCATPQSHLGLALAVQRTGGRVALVDGPPLMQLVLLPPVLGLSLCSCLVTLSQHVAVPGEAAPDELIVVVAV